MNYKDAPMLSFPPMPRQKHPRSKKAGIQFPAVTHPDTGLHVIASLAKTPRFKVWFHVDGKKRYTLLPRGIDIVEARLRRDRLYAALKEKYGAKRRTAKQAPPERKPYTVTVSSGDGKYIYQRPAFVVKIRGKQVAEARTRAEAERKRDAWLREHADIVPHITPATPATTPTEP